MRARILIVDDHDIVRQGARAILQKARPEWEICGEATTGREAVRAVAAYEPDVVILDISMPDMTGIEATPVIAKLVPKCRILLFTMHESDALLAEAQQLGAQGYVQKSQAGRDLVFAVDRLIAGGTFFGACDDSGVSGAGEKDSGSSNGSSSRAAAADDAQGPQRSPSRLGSGSRKSTVASKIGNFVGFREDLRVPQLRPVSPGRSILLLANYLVSVKSGSRLALYRRVSKLGYLTSS